MFEQLQEVSPVTMNRLANKAISWKKLARGDSLFQPGELATHMYFVTVGRLHYVKVDSKLEEKEEWVDKGEDWIAEPVLWTAEWVHLGVLTAVTECELLLIDASSFGEVV